MLVVMFESVTNKIAGFSLFKLLDVVMQYAELMRVQLYIGLPGQPSKPDHLQKTVTYLLRSRRSVGKRLDFIL